MKRFHFTLALLVPSCVIAGGVRLLEDGHYTLKITHVAKHPFVGSPRVPIPDEQYKATDEGGELQVWFSEKGKVVTILPRKISGSLERADVKSREYRLVRGLFAGGRLSVKDTPGGRVATFTEYGSGVPVISSLRGKLEPAKAKKEK